MLKTCCNGCFAVYSIRSRVVTNLSKKFTSIDEAEEHFCLDVDAYIMEESNQPVEDSTTLEPSTKRHCPGDSQDSSTVEQSSEIESTKNPEEKILDATTDGIEETLHQILEYSDESTLLRIANKAFAKLAIKNNINSNPADFVTLSLKAMKRLESAGKNNLLYKFGECIAKTRPGSDECLMPLDRMPFGLIEYQLEFFTCTNSDQVLQVIFSFE